MKLINNDCLIAMKDIPSATIDLIITDPPYGVEFSKGFNDSKEHVQSQLKLWIAEMYRVLKNGAHCYIFIPTLEAGMWIDAATQVFDLKNILSARNYTTNNSTTNNFTFNNQLILFLHKGKGRDLNDYDIIKTSDSWYRDSRNKNPKRYTYMYPAFLPEPIFANEKGTAANKDERHPCEKNAELLSFLVGISSNEGEVVMDPFMGNGSCGEAALKLKRDFIGIELNETYYDIAVKRINEVK